MTTAGSPSAFLLWTILSIIFLVFLLVHLWGYDRFQCVKWNSGRQPGAFKRVMTYSYLTTVPLLVVFSISITILKYMEGYIVLPSVKNATVNDVIPKPISLWSNDHVDWLLPIYFILAITWSLELVTHLEELTFWLYLMHQGPQKREWFHSWEFRVWYMGSIVAFLGLFSTTVMKRRDLETCPAWIFTVGSSADTLITVAFLYVIARFPAFIRKVKEEGGMPDVVVRLTTFYQLNLVRIVFRFFFVLPLLSIGLDGIQGSHKRIIEHPFLSDFLFMMGAIGCFISSAMTLMVFFPRSVTREQGYKVQLSTPHHRSIEKAPVSGKDEVHHVPPFIIDQNSLSSQMAAFKFPPDPSTSSPLPPNSRFYRNDEGQLVEASPEYQEEDKALNEEDYDELERSTLSHDTQSHASGRDIHPSIDGHTSSHLGHSYHNTPASSSPFPPPTPPPPPLLSSPHLLLHRQATDPHFLQRSVTNSPISRQPNGSSPLPRWRQTRQVKTSLHPYVQTFTSPIDLLDNSKDDLGSRAR